MKKGVWEVLKAALSIGLVAVLSAAVVFINTNNPNFSWKADDIVDEAGGGNYIFDQKSRYKAYPYQNGAVVLGNKTLVGLSENCSELFLHKVPYSNPQIVISGKYILLYDARGKDLMIIEDGNVLRNIVTDTPIICATINKSGNFAVACDKIGYKGLVTVYDKDYKEYYKWYSAENYILSMSLSNDGKHMAASTLKTDSDKVVGGILFFDLKKQNPESEFLCNEGLYLLIKYNDDSTVTAIGDRDAVVFDKKFVLKKQLPYEGKTLQYKAVSSSGLVVLGFFGKGKNTAFEVYDKNLNLLSTVNNENRIELSCVDKNYLFLCDGRVVYVYNQNGGLVLEKNIGKDISSFAVINKNKIIALTTQNAQAVVLSGSEEE
ncbi:MAG: hypothetical protein GX196_03025 [Clostridiaceae bacterium]|nr:hypothetical protein [Clostridiaceae bacterium]